MIHQYVDRETGRICTERLYQDRLIRFLYSEVREHAPRVFRALTGRRASRWLGHLNYDLALGNRLAGNRRFLSELNVDLAECVDPPAQLATPRAVFERKIRYWQCRPLPAEADTIVSPADARVLVGSLAETSQLRVKEKFFQLEELLGQGKVFWHDAFREGDFAVFRLTPDKYHYNHVPVDGRVVDFYAVDGTHHACNPQAVVSLATPYSKNQRVVTILDTDVPGGSAVGLVAMIEVVALMIGEVVQCYSAERYDDPRPVAPGMLLCRGAPKSLYRPGSSTDVLLFQRERVEFAADLVANLNAAAQSRFSQGFGQPLVETDVKVRSRIALRRDGTRSVCRESLVPSQEVCE